jgi:hypothetical protein
MGKKHKEIKESQLGGFKYFKIVDKMLQRLHDAGCARDKAGNRKLHMDQYASLILLYMFNPICDSLRAIHRVSELKKVQKNSVLQEHHWDLCLKHQQYSIANFSKKSYRNFP